MIDDSRLAYTINGAADYLALSKSAIYKLRKKGYIKAIKLGRFFIFPTTELDRFNEKCSNDEFYLNKVNEVISSGK